MQPLTISVLSESTADEAAIRIIVAGILGKPLEVEHQFPLKTRGWPSVKHILPSVLKHAHYRTSANALVVVVDSNSTPIHDAKSDKCGCRRCELSAIAAETVGRLRTVSGKTTIRIAVGLAVPAIEAWYLCGKDPRVSETAWRDGLASHFLPYEKNELKQRVYGTDRPSLSLETRRACEEAERLAKDIGALEQRFPNGFGPLAEELRRWQ